MALLTAFAMCACDGGSVDGPGASAATTLLAAPTWQEPIALPIGGEALRLSCTLEHADGRREEVPSAQVQSLHGTMSGTCAAVRASRSGTDTLEITARGLRTLLPVTVALPPEVRSGAFPTPLFIDSLPGAGVPWAPTLWRGPDGTVELYVGAIDGPRENLVRLRMGADNIFHFDATVFTPAEEICERFSIGYEHVAVIPRADGTGWRMLFAAGSPCHGWKVYSAVSPDAREWTIEPGTRVENGPELLWSQGEGLEVDRLPSGEWRMIMGGIVPVMPTQYNVYEILEWRSPDQITWTYVGKALSLAQMPEGANGTVYSPTVREFAPGLYRMIFTADNRDDPDENRSALWSAVSTDRTHWQVERELLGDPGMNLYYSTLVDELLVTVRVDVAGAPVLARATVHMP